MTFPWLNCSILLLLCLCCSTEDIQNSCKPPPRRDHEEPTDLSSKESYSHGEVVSFQCRPGYVRNRSIQFRCNNGSWERVLPAGECRKRSCGYPGDLQFGSFELIYEESFVFGARVVYKCDEGYQMLSKRNYRDCLTNGWSNSVPHCEAKKCFPVEEPENGKIRMSGTIDRDFEHGDVIYFQCNKDFKIQGSDHIFCTAHGNWSEPVPRCVEITCHLDSIEHGRIIAPKAVYKNGDQIDFSCDQGYKASLWSHATCYEFGWSTTPECIEIKCFPPEIMNGHFHPMQNMYKYRETIQIQCEPGYQIHERTSSCTQYGWSPLPRCIPLWWNKHKNMDYPSIIQQDMTPDSSTFSLKKGKTNAPESGASPTTSPALILEAILFHLLGNWILLF